MSDTFKKGGGETINPLARNFTCGALLQFALPSIFMMIFMGIYTIVDTIFVSRLVNTDALAAVNIVCPVINLTVGLGAMFASGGSAVISRKMGEEKEEEADRNFTFLVVCVGLLGGFISLFGTLFIKQIILFLGASESLYPYCREYLSVLLLFMPAGILQVLFQNFFVTAGRPGLGFGLAAAAGCVNGILDYLFIGIFHMGIAGAALGTGIGYLIPSVVGCIFFGVSKGSLKFCRFRPDWAVVLESCLNGSSEMVSQMSTAVTTFLFNRVMLELAGDHGVAAITILIYSQFLLSSLYLGFSMGVAPVIGFKYGNRNIEQLKQIFRSCLAFIGASSALVFCVSFLGGSLITRLFVKEQEEVYVLARAGFVIFSFSFLFSGMNIFTSSLFTALSNGKVSAVLSFLRTFGFITLGLLTLPEIIGINGVWLAVPVAEALTFCFSWAFLKKYVGF